MITAARRPGLCTAMPVSRSSIGRGERGVGAYWSARGGAFDSPARTPSTRQNLARETAPFTCLCYFRSFEASKLALANRVPGEFPSSSRSPLFHISPVHRAPPAPSRLAADFIARGSTASLIASFLSFSAGAYILVSLNDARLDAQVSRLHAVVFLRS